MAQEEDRIVHVLDLKASTARVWRALTDHEEFGTWFRVRLDGPFRIGETTTGNITYPGHEDMVWVSTTEVLETERCFAFSWPPSAVDPETRYDEDDRVRVEFALKSSPEGTRLTISESGFSVFPEGKRAEIQESCREGWTIQASNIAEFLGA